ncbi:MAG: hypothetical protein D6778_11000 [Nitrospirae bacterium]|nr:MAG: hypothetical protein D6778_11000 [Nitrospirota bacterium]
MSKNVSTVSYEISSPPLLIGVYFLVFLIVVSVKSLLVMSSFLLVWIFLGVLRPSIRLKTTVIMGLFLCVGVFLGNLFWGTGRVILEVGPLVVTDRAFTVASERALRLGVLIFCAKVLFTGRQSRLAGELRWLLRPLEKLGLKTETFVSSIEDTLRALPEVQAVIARRAETLRNNGASRVKAMGLAIYETFIQELQGQ